MDRQPLTTAQKDRRTFLIGLVIVIVVTLLVLFWPRTIDMLLPLQRETIAAASVEEYYAEPGLQGGMNIVTQRHSNDDPALIASAMEMLSAYRYLYIPEPLRVFNGQRPYRFIWVKLYGADGTYIDLSIEDTGTMRCDFQSEYRILGGGQQLYDQLYALLHP